MSPTSLANHCTSGTLKSRTLLPNAPWHRRLVRRLTSSPSRQRKLAILLLLLGACFLLTDLTDLTHHFLYRAAESGPDGPSSTTSASKAAIAKSRDRLVQFVPSQQERNKITLHYYDGVEPQAFVFPPPVIPRLKSPRPWNEWTELAWSERGPIRRIEMPFGTRMTFVNSRGLNRTIERNFGDGCEEGSCEGLRRFTVTQDELLALRQLDQLGKFCLIFLRILHPSTRKVVRLPSMFPSRLEDSTLVTQFSVSRLERFTQTLRIWDAPISLTIYLTEPSDGEMLSTFITNLDDELRAGWSKLSLTLVRPSYSTSRVALIRRLRYPINELRNHALRLAPTSYLLVLDADFIPSPMMHHLLQVRVPSLMSHGSETVGSPTQSRQALVISAFALAPSVKTTPRSLATLYEMLYATYPPSAYLTDPNAGHGPSLPSLLFHTTPLTPHPSQTHFRPSLHWSYKVCYEPQWESYYVLHRNSYPLFEERFSDQGGDKQSQTALLNAMGWEFQVLRDVWVTHVPKGGEGEGGANLDDWPGKKLGRLLDQELGERERTKKEDMVEDDEEGRHFNLAAQKDQKRYRYFQDFLPELERVFGGNWRWPRGCEANEVIKGKRVGRTASRVVFGL